MTIEVQKKLLADILDLSRQNNIADLAPWFQTHLEKQITAGDFLPESDLQVLSDYIVKQLVEYREQTGVTTVVLGMSGGVDSALTAALFKKAGWRVVGVTMPINQDPAETDRGVEACGAIGIEHVHIDLTELYEDTLRSLKDVDQNVFEIDGDDAVQLKAVRIRRGNVRARLRMITLYDLASMNGGLVASTDNFSELAAGFWTLHGDVGDVSPIQSLLKSWEVPYLARLNGVPESTVRATPTDGLGIDNGDEAQLGSTYLEFDIMAIELAKVVLLSELNHFDHAQLRELLEIEDNSRADVVLAAVTNRIRGSWFKRMNPVNLKHSTIDRYAMIENIDKGLFRPQVVR